MPNRITVKRVQELISYDPESGVFTRVGASRPQSAGYIGKTPGTVSDRGYSIISLDGRGYRAHHIAWVLMTGAWPETDVDHKNRNRTDNRWANLRLASRGQNLANSTRRRDNTSGVKGVSFDKARGKWRAQYGAYPNHFSRRFDTKEEAAAAYLAAATARAGKFASAA